MTLSLDLISHADLNATPSSLHQDDSPVTAHDRVYLILTYAAAYDRVHYPLPLQLVPPKRIQSTRRPQSPSIHIPHVPDISNTQDTATDTHASLVQEIASLQSHIHYLEQENKTHLNEISRLLRENDKLRHAVKHAHPSKTKQTSNRPLDGIRSDEMPHLFQALFQGLGTMISSPSSSSSRETFKKSLKALKRLVFRLLDEVGPPERVQDILEASAIPKSGNRPHSSSQRRSQAAKQKSSPVPNSSRYKSPAGSGYRPVKSQPLGLNTSLNSSSPAVLGSSSTRRKPVDSPRYTPNPPTRSNSATKLRSASSSTPFRRFDPTSYVIEKELKQLAARAQSQERLARARSLSAKRPSTAAVHSRTASLAI
ncbi:hypothetical protein BC830DRAFT_143201 [Chytriomyces sp. MP71]|nr:hypothetical protein BC830DRAFT_143201 [Chytriomyces sp. MP71]